MGKKFSPVFRIERLRLKIQQQWDKMNQDARQKAMAAMESLRKQRNDLAEWCGGIKYNSAGAWEKVKSGFIQGYRMLEQSFKKAAEKF